MNYLSNAGFYIVNTILGIYIFIVLLRFWLHWVKGDFRGPIGDLLIKLTTPVIKPFRALATSPQTWAFVCLGIAYLLTAIKNFLIVSLLGEHTELLGLIVYSAGEVIRLSIYIFLGAIFISIIASWLVPYGGNPVLQTVRSLSEPILLPARRLIPNFQGIDFSPILIIILLNVSLRLIADPMLDLGNHLGFPIRF